MRHSFARSMVAGIFVLLASSHALATAPSLVNYQGILTNGSGTPQTGTFNVTFSIYGVEFPSADPSLWSETQSVTTNSNGLFNVLLGAVTPLNEAFFAGPDRWLAIYVSPELADMTPRTRIASVAYAFRPATVDGATGGNITSKVSIGTGHTNTGADAFVAGFGNTVSGFRTFVGGGTNNIASGDSSTVAGGALNLAAGIGSVVGGGRRNKALGAFSTVAGGGGTLPSDSNTAIGSWTTIGGGRGHSITGDGATIAGGEYNQATVGEAFVGGGAENIASNQGSSVVGGEANTAGGFKSFIGGGANNLASGDYSVGAGGEFNQASGGHSTVGGGLSNEAGGQLSWAGGYNASANFDGAFVWADANFQEFPSAVEPNFTPGPNNFLVRATGGVVLVTAIDPLFGESLSGVQLASGGGAWAVLSDRRLKENYEPIDGEEVLDRLASIPIGKWNYLAQDDSIRHIGPMAQDFYAAFGVGEDDKHITTIDADGVALAAIQALHAKTKEIDELRVQVAELREQMKLIASHQLKK